MNINKTINLPCGITLKNRLAKSAMSENMAKTGYNAGPEFFNLYKRWADGGLGLSISGNVMIDKNHLGEINNIVMEEGIDNTTGLKKWSKSNGNTGNQIWIQLNHPGRQCPNFLSKDNVSCSAVPFDKPLDSMFSTPRALTNNEILDIIKKFGNSAKIVKDCGFDGVQIHGAHGYLVAQFLSPKTNIRTDQWGGCLENRMRFVIEIYKSIRSQVGNSFPVSIKINTADFQKGGFSHEESIQVTKKLSELGIDLIEISGGTYEKPAMSGSRIKKSTQKREAYFLEYAKDIKKVVNCPIMVTGGFRTGTFMHESLENGELDIIGLARPVAINPDLPNQLLSGEDVVSEVKPLTSGFKFLDRMYPLEIIWYTDQIHRMGKGRKPRRKGGVYASIFNMTYSVGIQALKRVRS